MKKHYLFIFTFFSMLSTLAQIPQNGLVSSYRFEGTLTADSVGTNTLTTNNLPALATGYENIVHTAAGFNADGMLSSTSGDFQQSSFTFACWVQLTNTNAYHTFGNVRLQTSSFPYNSFNLVAGTAVSNYLTFFYNTDFYLMQGNPTTDLVLQDYTGPLSLNTWYHVAVTVNYNSSLNSSIISLYRDGVQVNTVETYGQIVYNGNPFTLGNITGAMDNTNGLRGSLDEVLFYNRALAPIEVCELVHTYLGTPCPLQVAAPSNLTTSVSGQQVTLNWQDNSTNESFFRVATSEDGVNFANVLGDVPANTTTYSYSANPGTHYYRVFAYSEFDTSDVTNIATATVTSTAGLNEETAVISVFPNPASSMVTIQSTQPLPFHIFNVQGVEMATGTLNEKTTVDVSGFAPGMYFLQVSTGNTVQLIVH